MLFLWRLPMGAGIIGVGGATPRHFKTNADLEKILDTNDEWIYSRTGIKSRYVADPDEQTSDFAYAAALKALQNANLCAQDIDMILVATMTPDMATPSVACLVQEKLGAFQAAAMDVNAACTGFIYAVVTAAQFIQTKVYQNILVIGSEKMTGLLDWTDRTVDVLFGDGAGAVIVSEVGDKRGLLAFELGADGRGKENLYANQRIYMNGNEVFKFAVRKMEECTEILLDRANLNQSDVDYLIPHQANIRIMEAARRRLNLPKEKMSCTVQKYGNTSSASIPLSLWESVRENKLKPNDIVLMVGFGAGLSWGGLVIKW